MGNFHGFFTKKIPWLWHENLMKKALKSPQYSTLHGPWKNCNKKKKQWKCHEIKWSRSCVFHGFFIIMKKPWIEKLFFMVSEFMGFSWGFSNSCPIKRPWVFRVRLNINGSWKMKWLLMTFSLPMNYTPGLLFMGKTETWPPWKFSLKLFSTVKSNTSLRICWLVNLKLYTCSNNPNPK